MDIIILATWAIWISRNNLIFQQIQPSFQNWKVIYYMELNLLKYRMKKKYSVLFQAWLDALM